ncbi:MAG: ATP-binding cassette domain-containing protein, partial [Nitriliruptoraceae bacterium]
MGTIPDPAGESGRRADSAHPDNARDADRAGPVVVVDGCTVTYGDTTAVNRVTVEFARGQLTAIIGPNGSGKSTLLHAIAGLVVPTAGSVRVLGSPAGDRPADIALVMQANIASSRVPLTVRETVRMGRYARTGAFRRLTRADRQAVDE